MSNLAYERANVLYNLAALYCQLAKSEDRSNGDGIKRAMAYFQVSFPCQVFIAMDKHNSFWLSHDGLLIVECRRRVVASRIHRLTSLANFSSFQHVDTGRPFRVTPESTSAAYAFPSAGMFLAKGSSGYVLPPLLHIKLETDGMVGTDSMKNHLVAKLSWKTSLLYRDTLDAMENNSTAFPRVSTRS